MFSKKMSVDGAVDRLTPTERGHASDERRPKNDGAVVRGCLKKCVIPVDIKPMNKKDKWGCHQSGYGITRKSILQSHNDNERYIHYFVNNYCVGRRDSEAHKV